MIPDMTHIGYTTVKVEKQIEGVRELFAERLGEVAPEETEVVNVYFDRGHIIIEEPYPTEIKLDQIEEWTDWRHANKLMNGPLFKLECDGLNCKGLCKNPKSVGKGHIRNGFFIEEYSKRKYPIVFYDEFSIKVRTLQGFGLNSPQFKTFKVVLDER